MGGAAAEAVGGNRAGRWGMPPAQWIGLGLLLVAVHTDFFALEVDGVRAGWDLVPDPVGWAMVAVGVWDARALLAPVGPLLWSLGAAELVSVAVYAPEVAVRLSAPFAWALSLPQAAVVVLLSRSLADLPPSAPAERGGGTPGAPGQPDRVPRRRLRGLAATGVAVGLAPAVVLGGGLEEFVPLVGVLATVVLLTLTVTVFGLTWRLVRDPAGATPHGPAA